jgi:hypothetical protein
MSEDADTADELKAQLEDAMARRYCADMIEEPFRRCRELDRWDRQVAFLRGKVAELEQAHE